MTNMKDEIVYLVVLHVKLTETVQGTYHSTYYMRAPLRIHHLTVLYEG